ncbi:MAG: FMN-binding protein [Trebonia sp.]
MATRYGDVEVQVTFDGNRLTAVTPLKLPDSNSVDQAIDQQVGPILVQESLAAQSANIDAISGAMYTSEGYIPVAAVGARQGERLLQPHL